MGMNGPLTHTLGVRLGVRQGVRQGVRLGVGGVPDAARRVEGVSAQLTLQHGSHGGLLTETHLQVAAGGRWEQLRLIGRPQLRERVQLPDTKILQSQHLGRKRRQISSF